MPWAHHSSSWWEFGWLHVSLLYRCCSLSFPFYQQVYFLASATWCGIHPDLLCNRKLIIKDPTMRVLYFPTFATIVSFVLPLKFNRSPKAIWIMIPCNFVPDWFYILLIDNYCCRKPSTYISSFHLFVSYSVFLLAAEMYQILFYSSWHDHIGFLLHFLL